MVRVVRLVRGLGWELVWELAGCAASWAPVEKFPCLKRPESGVTRVPAHELAPTGQRRRVGLHRVRVDRERGLLELTEELTGGELGSGVWPVAISRAYATGGKFSRLAAR